MIRRQRTAWWRAVDLLAAFLFIATLGKLYAAEAPTDAWLDAQLDEAHEIREGFELLDLCRLLNRPCGLEETHLREFHRGKRGVKLSLKKTTPRKVLDLIAQHHPTHRAVVREGVVILEPRKRIGEDMLARRIDHVSIRDSLSLQAADDVLRQAGIMGGGISMTGDPFYACIDLELSSITVRAALNAIAKADGQVMWSYAPRGPGSSGKDGARFYLFSWGRSGRVGLAHEKLGFVYPDESGHRRSCRELKKYFQ